MFEPPLNDSMQLARWVLAVSALALLLVAAYIDIRRFIIPNWLNAALLALGLFYAALSSFSASSFPWIPHLACFALFFAAGTLMFGFGLLGGGDVKLMAVVAFWSGSQYLMGFLVYTAVAGGVVSIVYLLRAWLRRRAENGAVNSGIKEVAAQAVLAHTGLLTDSKAYISNARKSSLMQEPVPYGVAIAVGGVYVFASIAGHLG